MGFVIRSSSSYATPATPQENAGVHVLVTASEREVASPNKANADRFAANVLPVIEQIKGERPPRHCVRSPKRSTRAALPTARGGIWTPVQVTAVLRRASCPNTTVSRISGESGRQNKTSRR